MQRTKKKNPSLNDPGVESIKLLSLFVFATAPPNWMFYGNKNIYRKTYPADSSRNPWMRVHKDKRWALTIVVCASIIFIFHSDPCKWRYCNRFGHRHSVFDLIIIEWPNNELTWMRNVCIWI